MVVSHHVAGLQDSVSVNIPYHALVIQNSKPKTDISRHFPSLSLERVSIS